MAESLVHKELVRDIRYWIEANYQVRGLTFLWIDNCVEEGYVQQKRIDNFIPDIYARCLNDNLEIIGEAKTGSDIQSRHSEEQFLSYLKYCNYSKAIFILAVPYVFRAFAKNLIGSLGSQTDTLNAHVIVIDNLMNKICRS